MERPIQAQRLFLVDDIVAIIIDHFAQDSGCKDLVTLSLVSSAWLTSSRRALYASVQLFSYHSCYLLSRTLADNPEFGDRIHALHLHPVPRVCSSGSSCSCLSVNVFALSLSPLFRLRNLSEITLGGDCAIHTEQYLRSFVFPQTIRKLRVEGMQWYWSFRVNRPVNASLRWTEGVASRFTSLRNLELINLDLRICELEAFKPRLPHLESLYMDRVRITRGKLSHLAYNAWDELRELTLIVSEHCGEHDACNILTEASRSLLAFKYFIKEDSQREDLDAIIGVEAIASCTALRDLQLSAPFGHSVLKTLGSRLDQLELLKVYNNYEIDIEEWALEISKGSFPSLREIHLPIGHELRRLADSQWPALRVGTIRKACAARGISLTYAYLTDYTP